MAIEYEFFISTGLAPESLMRIMLLGLGLPWDPNAGCVSNAPHFHASVGPLRGDSGGHLRPSLGFAPDVYFVFKVWGPTTVEGKEDLVCGTLAICQAVAGDAALLFNSEIVLFLRKEGTLYVNSAYWRGDYSLFKLPHELKDFPVL